MKFLAGVLDGVEVLLPEPGRIEEVSNIHAHGQVTAVAHLVVEIEHFKISTGAVDACDAVLVGPFHARAKGRKFFGARRLWNDLGDQILG